jgi:hypothetical protein
VSARRPAPDRCVERPWCAMTDLEEHAQYHASDAIDLAEYDAANDTGWSAWIVEDVGKRPVINIEGVVLVGDAENAERQGYDVEIDAAHLAIALWATSTPEAREALDGLLDQFRDVDS